MAAVVAAGTVLWATETMIWAEPLSSNRAFIYIAFAAALPGALLYRWGRGVYVRPTPTREMVAKAMPPRTAGEMGHVRRISRIRAAK
jgi:hypothetical protein